jgi:phosphoheptose isomerase
MTKAELLAYAQKKGITASGNKDEILAAIKAAGKPGPKNLEAITDEELLAYAADHEIDVTGANREEILAEIKAAEGND